MYPTVTRLAQRLGLLVPVLILNTDDPDRSITNDDRSEIMIAANWLFSGHDNKLTFDISKLTFEYPNSPRLGDKRIRLQWDISF
jgi:hypothetical protein